MNSIWFLEKIYNLLNNNGILLIEHNKNFKCTFFSTFYNVFFCIGDYYNYKEVLNELFGVISSEFYIFKK